MIGLDDVDAEIGVVGAGPAGARAAELLSRAGAEVLVLDPRAPWEKPCGGGLPASAFEHVPELEQLRPSARRIDFVLFETTAEEGFRVPLDRPMYMISRCELARWQLSRMEEAGVARIRAAVRSIRDEGGGWTLEDREGRSWRVRLLVGADGAASLVRRVASPELSVELAPTRVSYPEGAGATPGTVLVRLFDDVQGYFWDFARPDHRSVGVGTEPGRWKRSRMDREIDVYRASVVEDREAPSPSRPRTGAVIGTAALGHGDFSAVGGPRFALLGDAAGFADPATGEGIQNALRSAGALAEAYRSSGSFVRYPELARRAFGREFRASRMLRAVLFGVRAGPFLVRRGRRAAWAYSLISGVMNATNEHDLGPWGIVRRSVRAYRRGRPEAAAPDESRMVLPRR